MFVLKSINSTLTSSSSLLVQFLFNSWDLMINTTNQKSGDYFLSELKSNNFTADAFSWFFEFCTHLSDITDRLNKTLDDNPSPFPPTDHEGHSFNQPGGVNGTGHVAIATLPPMAKAIFVLLLLITSLASVLGNVISVWVTFRIRSSHTTSCFLICLAVSDLLQTFTICASETANILYDWQWIYGAFLCKAIPFVQTAGALANALTLSCIAVGRYLAVTATLRWQTLELRKISTLALIFIWSFSILICAPISFLFEFEEAQHHEMIISKSSSFDLTADAVSLEVDATLEQARIAMVISDSSDYRAGANAERQVMSPSFSTASSLQGSKRNQQDNLINEPHQNQDSSKEHSVWTSKHNSFCWWSSSKNEVSKRIYFYVVPACMFLPLFLITAVMYMTMARYLWQRKPIGEVHHVTQSSTHTKAKYRQPKPSQQVKRGKIVKLLALLILVFLCCRGPVQVFNILQGIKKYKLTSSVLVIRNCLTVIKLLNCALNPLLYCLLHERFKSYLVTLLKRVACRLPFNLQITTVYSQSADTNNRHHRGLDGSTLSGDDDVLAEFRRSKSCEERTKPVAKKKKKISVPLAQFAYAEKKLAPLLKPRSGQRGELSWSSQGQSLTLERLINETEHHSI